MNRSPPVDKRAVKALLHAFELECEGTNETSSQPAIPDSVAGYFWPDDDAPDTEDDGRAPLGVVLARIRAEVEACAELGADERLVLMRNHGLDGAVSRVTTKDPQASLASRLSSVRAPAQPMGRARARAALDRAYHQLAQSFGPRNDRRPTRPTRRRDPIDAPWLHDQGLTRSDDATRRVVAAAAQVASQWCAIGGTPRSRTPPRTRKLAAPVRAPPQTDRGHKPNPGALASGRLHGHRAVPDHHDSRPRRSTQTRRPDQPRATARSAADGRWIAGPAMRRACGAHRRSLCAAPRRPCRDRRARGLDCRRPRLRHRRATETRRCWTTSPSGRSSR